MLTALAPARRRLVLAVLGLVLAGLAAAAVLLAQRPGAEEPRAVPQQTPGPVLLVPGYGQGQGSLAVLRDALDRQGRDATVVALPGDGTGDLARSADALAAAATDALERTGADSVDVVGYSAGGVVARLWVADGGADVVRRVVTLGSPHHGTTLADLAADVAPQRCPVGCAQLGTGSDLLARLNAGDETPTGPTWVSIWSEQDRTVTPPESARLEGALNIPVQSVCPGAEVGHGELPRAPVVQALVLAVLGPGAPAPPSAEVCPRG